MPRVDAIPGCPQLPAARSPGRMTREYQISLITPLFGSGATPGQPDEDFPIRGTAIRGQLRFWWGATRGTQFANYQNLFERHAAIWGTTERASPVEVVIRSISAGPLQPCAEYDVAPLN